MSGPANCGCGPLGMRRWHGNPSGVGNPFDGMNASSSTSMRRCRPPSIWKRCSSYSMRSWALSRRPTTVVKLTSEIRLQQHAIGEHLGRIQIGDLAPLKSPQHQAAAVARWGRELGLRGGARDANS